MRESESLANSGTVKIAHLGGRGALILNRQPFPPFLG
jgi:hypothetical protein